MHHFRGAASASHGLLFQVPFAGDRVANFDEGRDCVAELGRVRGERGVVPMVNDAVSAGAAAPPDHARISSGVHVAPVETWFETEKQESYFDLVENYSLVTY